MDCPHAMCTRCIQIPEAYQRVVDEDSVRFQCVACHLLDGQRAKDYTPYIVSILFPQSFQDINSDETATGIHEGQKASPAAFSSGDGKFRDNLRMPPYSPDTVRPSLFKVDQIHISRGNHTTKSSRLLSQRRSGHF